MKIIVQLEIAPLTVPDESDEKVGEGVVEVDLIIYTFIVAPFAT